MPNHSIDRRRFLLASGAALAGASWGGSRLPAAPLVYERLDSDAYLGAVETVATVEAPKVFTEGPAVAANGDVLFTNVPMGQILRWERESGSLRSVRDDSGQTNGLCFDSRGRLICCEGGRGRVTRYDLASGHVEVLAQEFRGFALPAPNDACVDRLGRIYFSSRPGGEDSAAGNVNAVYRLDPDGSLHQVLAWPRVHMPNGLALSPDQRTFYLVESHPDADRHRDLRAYAIDERGDLSDERVLAELYPGRSGDGMCVGDDGLLYVAAGLHKTRGTSETLDTRPGIHVFTPAGTLVAFRETPEDTLTNCDLDRSRRLLYATCGARLLRIPLAAR